MGEARGGGKRAAGRARSSSREQFIPIGFMLLALLFIVVLMPSALRPPPEQANASAQFSPDAPPDNSDSIVAALGRGQSGVSGAGSDGAPGAGVGPDQAAPNGVPQRPTTPPAVPVARSCKRGVGDPPRQTFSLYSAPCAPAWQGDNGGATAKGVTGDEIRIQITPAATTASYTGPVPRTQPASGETPQDRTYRVFQQWINENFQSYGRYIQFYLQNPPDNTDSNSARRAAVIADEDFHVFGITTSQPSTAQEGVRRKLVVGNLPWFADDYYANNQPYSWSWYIGGTTLAKLNVELICKQLAGKQASLTDDLQISGQKRVFGLVWSQQFFVGVDDAMWQRELKNTCGEQFAQTVSYGYYTDQSPQNLATAISLLRSQGVTTVVCSCDFVAPASLTQSATQQGWFPEWVMTGFGDMDFNNNGQLYDQRQWSHMVGMSGLETMMPVPDRDYYRAFKEIDPANTPDNAVGRYLFHELVMFANGIQLAGPQLTPESFMAGLKKLPVRPPDPSWSVGGGFGPNDYTYSKYVSLVWWDPTAIAPDNGSPGAYKYLYNSKRYKLGEIPKEPLPWMKDGVTSVAR